MAELTNLESKVGEVTGLAMAAQAATTTVLELADGEDAALVSALEKMRQEAIETEQRCTELAGTFEGKKTAIQMGANAGHAGVDELVRWALPIQQRHFEGVLAGSKTLAASEDPNDAE